MRMDRGRRTVTAPHTGKTLAAAEVSPVGRTVHQVRAVVLMA